MLVAFQGEAGAYSEIAAGRLGQARGYRSFAEVFEAVARGEAPCGMLPVENSLGGPIYENLDLLLKHPVEIVADTYVRIEHCLLGLPGAKLEDARQVLSHPQALVQCDQFLGEHPEWEKIATYDTAGSAKLVRDSGDPAKLAIASEKAGQLYGLHVLRRDIATLPDNFTRFAAIAKAPADKAKLGVPTGGTKTSIVFSLPHETGSLFHALSVFALRKINLTKLVTRPLRGGKFEYLFYIDFEEAGPGAPTPSKASQQALSHLQEIAPFLKVLGSYSTIAD